MREGKCTLNQILRWMCSGPAELYKIPNKGRLVEGYDADLALVDIEGSKEVRDEEVFSRTGWSPFSGRVLSGWPTHTIVGGRVVFENGVIRPGVFGEPLSFGS